MNYSKHIRISALVLVGSAVSATQGGTENSYTQNFNTLGSAPFATYGWANNSTIPGWYAASGPAWNNLPTTPTVYRANNGTSADQYFYSVGTYNSSDRAFGAKIYGSWTAWGVKLTNAGPAPVNNEITVTFTGEQWRDQGTQPVHFAYKVGATQLNETYTGVSELRFDPPHTTGPAGTDYDGNLSANRVVLSHTFTLNATWATGTELWLKWLTSDSQGAILGIDDLTVSWSVAPQGTVVTVR